ncbi:MAG: response regulator transcription factor, partial [Burkholderiales bacterium]
MNAEHHAPLAIVVVDDHPLFTDGLRYQLEAIVPSARVECFGTLREACAALDSELSCGLILLDLALPDAQGFEALTRLRAIRPDVPAVILSGMDEARLIVQCLEHGAAGFIPKSASQRRTVHALEHVLSGGVYVPEEVASYAGVDLARVRDVASRARARFAGAAADPDRQSPSMSGSGA